MEVWRFDLVFATQTCSVMFLGSEGSTARIRIHSYTRDLLDGF
jgi:hypothetical protein